MKILFSGDSPTVTTGFGIVTKNILNRLVAMGHEVTVLGVNHYGEPYDQKEFPYQIYPCDKGSQENIFGIYKLWYLEQKLKPDLIFFLNDPWIIDQFLDARPEKRGNPYGKTLAYYPTDGGPLKPKWAQTLTERCDIQVCYSHYAERVIQEANGFRPKNLRQIYHGVDTSTFFPVDKQVARFRLGLPKDAFMIGMVARNQFRKRFDILMKAFADFAIDKPEAMLYLHTAQKDIGYDINDLSRQLGLKDKLLVTDGMEAAHGVSDTHLNLIYNAFDVNTLISLGDGFGLPVAESMATGCVQVVSDHSCLKELVEGHGGLTVKTAAWILNTSGINTWGGISDEADLTEKLNLLYKNKELRVKQAEQGYNFIMQDKFKWDFAANEFQEIIKQMFHIL